MKVLNKSQLSCTPANAVYIGRPSKWGNPFVIGVGGRTRQQVVHEYKRWLWSQKDLLWEAGQELAGLDLVCHCAPLACHGDVLIAAIDWMTDLPARDYDKHFPLAVLEAQPSEYRDNDLVTDIAGDVWVCDRTRNLWLG